MDRHGPRVALVTMSLLLTASVSLLLVPGVAPAYSAFVVLGLASGLNGTVSGAVWARTYETERLGGLQSTGEAARVGAAAIGPLPLALSPSLAGSYAAGFPGLAVFSAVCVALGARWRPSVPSFGVG